ncbi:uncharacterized acetyltransferase At3g50280-like [Neltuma alba]|uniref:uncharacterized acetyltransferase At3g50280-like n=1 Tax=Neltuma alba TaxID=207710 RepID=UPI0010A563CF|nr:uncharacterized acetyltransferase At3g50280-like [Prosopis alba]
MAAGFRVISTTTIQAGRCVNHEDPPKKIDLNPWGLRFLLYDYAQKGVLFHKPPILSPSNHTRTLIQHLKDSFSSTLDFFLPLAGRLAIVRHGDDGTSSVFITCNNAGASFVHAIAENTTIADILEPVYVPPVVQSFFPQSNSKTFEGTRIPLLAAQVTELVDGIFIACSINHCIADMKTVLFFLNTWAKISRDGLNLMDSKSNGLNHIDSNSNVASFEQWFPHGNIKRPLRIPFREAMENYSKQYTQPPPFPKRIFHFKREKIAELKAKAKSEVEDGVIKNRISSLQAVIGHIWGSVIRNQHLDPEEDVTYRFVATSESRVSHPPIPDNYVGNTVQFTRLTMKVRDLLGDGGHGKFVSQMNKIVSSYTQEKIKREFEDWVQNPTISFQSGTMGMFWQPEAPPGPTSTRFISAGDGRRWFEAASPIQMYGS